jgi:dienelactone hydrolase
MRAVFLFILVCTSSLAAQSSGPAASPTRAAFLKVIERPPVDLRPEVRPLPADSPAWVREHISFSVEPAQRVSGILIKAAAVGPRRPVVIQLHGTGGNKEQLIPRLNALADHGFIAVAIDSRYHGERAGKSDGSLNPYAAAIVEAYKTGREHPFFFDTVFDVMRLIDYLETRPDVDASRIGLGGFSKGGIEAYLAAAADPRIAATVSGHGVQSFGWALDHGAWDSRAWTIRDALEAVARMKGVPVTAPFVREFYDRVAPGIYREFDAPAMLPLVAPRPFLMINGDSDPRTPVAGVRESAAAAERAYEAAGAQGRFALQLLPNVGHERTPMYDEAMVEWFVRWLKPVGGR